MLDRPGRTVSDGRGYNMLPMHRTVIVQCIQAFEPTEMRFCDWPGSMGPTTFGSSDPRLAETNGQAVSWTCSQRWSPDGALSITLPLNQALEDLLGRDVDVVTETSLHPRIREKVLREAISLQ